MRMAYYRPPMTERTLLHALEQVRRECIYGADGLEHVDALLKLRGVDPDSLYVPRKMPDRQFPRGYIKRFVLAALRERPQTAQELTDKMCDAHPDRPRGLCSRSVHGALRQGERLGTMAREGKVWRLTPPAANTP